MKKFLLWALFLALALAVPISAMAGVNVNVGIALPPPLVFAAPPALIVLPETYVYFVPDVDEDIFFYDGWWWRPWEGRWYRSRYYDRGWTYYRSTPSFYRGIPSDWRNDYRGHRWKGHQWNYQPIPLQQVQRNWSGWKKSRHWEKQQTWNVQDLRPQPRSRQPSPGIQPRRSQPQVREVKPEQPQQRHQNAGPEAGVPKPQHQEAGPQSHEGQPQHSQPQQGDHERGKGEKQDRR
jgi:hypothetical protein